MTGLVRLAAGLYALLLRLYPADFRRACGGAMLETFETVARERARARGPIGFLLGCLPDYADVLSGARAARRGPGVRRPDDPRGARLDALWHDARGALRRLRTQPGVVALTVLTLGFAIAANAALFSIVDAVLLRPSPFAGADRLVAVYSVAPRGFTYPGLNAEKLRHWRAESDLFEAIEAYRVTPAVVTGGAEAMEVGAAWISPGILDMLGVPPRLGRAFEPADVEAGRPPVVLVSARFWRAHLGGDAGAIGRRVTVNGRALEVIGVMPDRFRFPSLDRDLWLPMDPAAPGTGGPPTVIARLREGLTPAAAQARIDAIVPALEEAQPIPSGWNIRVSGETFASIPAETRRAVLILFGAVTLLLLTAGANVANVLLSRAVERRREFAVRLALGAARGRILRELAIEGLLLGAAAAALGVLAARWSIDGLVRLAPADLTVFTTTPIAVDARVAGVALVVAMAAGVLCNLLPALRLLHGQGADALAGRAVQATPKGRRTRGALVAIEVALSVMLLAGAVLLARSFTQLNAIDAGFEPDGVLAVSVGLDNGRYATEPARLALLEAVAARVAALPGVQGVAMSSGLPPRAGDMTLAHLETEAGPCHEEPRGVVSNMVTPAYFGVTRTRLVAGRALAPDDPADTVVISAAVQRLCGGAPLVGRRIRLGPGAPWATVAGVTGDVKALGLRSDRGDLAIYSRLDAGTFLLPNLATRVGDNRYTTRRLLVRAAQPEALVAEVRRAFREIDPDQPVLAAAPATELMADSIRQERFMLRLMTLFSIVALGLAAAGIFGVLAYLVARRTREIGIRMALGATPGRVLGHVVGEGVSLAGVGLAAGLAGALALSRVLAGLLYEVDPRDPAAFAGTAALVLAVTLLASAIPAWRAFSIQPSRALREE